VYAILMAFFSFFFSLSSLLLTLYLPLFFGH
jgi:hypothetical protein